ncbi:DUF3108 domain-containing protein [Silvimonas amylolytica]|uniref:DUF3108 domain-containing protein n=1 Tax=Silvimonas amylolytica TaxID=449663 RepID=A0ABQ2PQK7_9NEIS|nr:DUF3108 domain-containing protein [Silvimonas amylolytica]GGP27737.1 hypothetical protein GCM10010971_35560 [Silvimonas amylolytica]
MSKTGASHRWRAPHFLLILAFVLSLLTHIFSATGDLIYDWFTNTSPDKPNEKLRKPTRTLKSQDWEDEKKLADELKNIKRPDIQTVWFAAKVPPKPVVVAKAEPPPPPTPRLVPKRKPKPAIRLASAAASTPIASSTAIASAAASAPQSWFGNASAPAKASTVAAAALPHQASAASAVAATRASSPAVAAAPSVNAAFPKTVHITYRWKGFPAKLTWTAGDGRYTLDIGAAMLGRSRVFSSVGTISKRGLAPERFSDTRDGKLQNEALFDWSEQKFVLHDGDKTIEGPLQPGDQDLFSAAFQFALQGASMPSFTFSLASGRKIYSNVAFQIMGEKTLRLSGKDVDAILLRGTFEDRVFDFWLAPQWHNLPVRMILNAGKDTYDVFASDIDADGKTLLESPTPGLDQPHGPRG